MTRATKPTAAVRIAARAPNGTATERTLAEAFEAGASGAEEREGDAPGVTQLLLYASPARGDAVQAAARRVLGDAAVGEPEPVAPVDWSEAWKAGLGPIRISDRLVIRPSWVPFEPAPGERVLVIDPKQAFGTGGHESTRLALALLGDALPALGPEARVLDVGTGSGVLALAALALGARSAVGFDLDPLAAPAAAENAALNGAGAGLRLFTGSIEAIAGARFALVVANLLRSEVVPILPALAAALAPGGRAIFSGLLSRERETIAARLAAVGLRIEAAREETDASGEAWLGLLTRR